MASRTRPRASSEILPGNKSDYGISSSIDLVSEAFYRYQLPTNLGQDSTGLADGIQHRIQTRFLGLSSLKLGSCCFPNTAFYEITESEISEIAFSDKKQRSSSEPESGYDGPDDDGDKAIGASPECVDALLSLAGSSPVDSMMLDDVAAAQHQHHRSPSALPPKKRRRRRVIRKDVVFCLCLDEHDPREAFLVLCPDRDYFLFPRDAVVEAVNQVSPFEVMFSYHLPKQSESSALLHSVCSCRSSESNPVPTYQSKLEEFAAVCSDHLASSRALRGSSAQRRFTDPGLQPQWKSECHVLNMQMSGVSKDLYIAMKQVVSSFEAVCQRMMELMRLHTERVTCEKSEAKEESNITKIEAQSEEDDVYDKTHTLYESTSGVTGHWSSDENSWDKDLDNEQDETDYCIVSPHSKTTREPPSPSTTSTLPKASPVTTAATTSTSSSSKARLSGSGGNCLKKCLYCGSKSTPMWRRGPQGAGTLCNACGVKWKHGKILCGSDAPQPQPQPPPSSSRVVTGKEQYQEQAQPQNPQRRNSIKATADKRRKKTSAAAIKKDRRNKLRQQRKRVNLEPTMEFSDEEDMMTGIQYSTSFTTTAPRDIASATDHRHQQSLWEQAPPLPPQPNSSSLSSYSQSLDDSCSPLESFSSSPNSSIHDPLLDKLAASSFPLSDAVEAATVLTLLKRS